MRRINLPMDSHFKKIVIISGVTLLLMGCMPNKIKETIEKTEIQNQELAKNEGENEDEVVTETQKQLLNELEEVTPEEANDQSVKDKRQERSIKKPLIKEKYADVDEFAEYISYQFYLYHTKSINGSDFYKAISPHFHNDFKTNLPDSPESQKETFEILQDKIVTQFKSEIEYVTTSDIEINPRSKEANFYRTYKFKNGEQIHYMTIVKEENNQWYLVDDSPAPSYTVINK